MTKTSTFTCAICETESTRICGRCTKDMCGNHLCERCAWCSDCCACEVKLDVSLHNGAAEPAESIPERELSAGV